MGWKISEFPFKSFPAIDKFSHKRAQKNGFNHTVMSAATEETLKNDFNQMLSFPILIEHHTLGRKLAGKVLTTTVVVPSFFAFNF